MNLSRLALVGCVLALCAASVQAQQSYPANNNAGQNYSDSGYADGGQVDGDPVDGGQVDGDYADDDGGYADGDYCDDGGVYGGGYLASLFSQRRGLFYFTAEAIALRRNNQAKTRTIIVDNLGADYFNSRSLQFNDMIGQRYTVGYMTDEQTAIEATYFSIDNWSHQNLFNAGGNLLSLPGALGDPGVSFDYNNADVMAIYYSARLISAELNVIKPLAWPDIGFLAGFRFLQLNEQFIIQSLNSAISQSSDYNTQTTNNLYGGQIGTRIRKQWDLFGIELTAKAGLFDNDSRQRNYVLDQNNENFLRPLRGANTHSAAFVGDINLTTTYRINTNVVLRLGYNTLWVERIALAPDQLSFTNPTLATSGTGINHHQGIFAHGLNAGLEFRF